MKKQKVVKTLIIIFSLLVLSYIIWYSFSNYYNFSDRTGNLKKEIAKGEYPVIGWVRVQGTNIDYPVLYALDGKVDIDNIDPNYSFAWKNYYDLDGLNRKVLLGHNVRNVSSKPLINEKKFNNFENLPSFLYYDFVKDNKYIQYTDEKNNYLYKIYAVYLQNEEENDALEKMSSSEVKKYINRGLKKSYFKFDTDVNEKDKIMTLITCTRFFDSMSYSLIIDARMVRKDEKIKNYKVTKKSTYKKIEKYLEGDDSDEEKA